MKDLLSISKAAETLGVHAQTLRNWDKAGKLKSVRTLGGHRRYRLADIRASLLKKSRDRTLHFTIRLSEELLDNANEAALRSFILADITASIDRKLEDLRA
jgi:excisionase family DNA binding protein